MQQEDGGACIVHSGGEDRQSQRLRNALRTIIIVVHDQIGVDGTQIDVDHHIRLTETEQKQQKQEQTNEKGTQDKMDENWEQQMKANKISVVRVCDNA